jgi:hypothetical protein
MNLRVTLRSANSFGFDGKLAAKSGTTLTLATSAVDADDQFNDGFAIVLYDSAGLVEAKSCIVDSTNTGETILTAADISSLISVNDNYIVQPDAGCKLDNASVELAACPNGTSSLGTMIKYLYQLGRHKLTQTSSTGTLFKDDASTSLCTFSNSDNGTTFTRGEAS